MRWDGWHLLLPTWESKCSFLRRPWAFLRTFYFFSLSSIFKDLVALHSCHHSRCWTPHPRRQILPSRVRRPSSPSACIPCLTGISCSTLWVFTPASSVSLVAPISLDHVVRKRPFVANEERGWQFERGLGSKAKLVKLSFCLGDKQISPSV